MEVETEQWFITAGTGLIGTVIGAAISIWNQQRLELRKAKIDCIRKIAGYRFDTESNDFLSAINQVPVLFSGNVGVVEAFVDHGSGLKSTSTSGSNECLIKLLNAAAKDVGLPTHNIAIFAQSALVTRSKNAA